MKLKSKKSSFGIPKIVCLNCYEANRPARTYSIARDDTFSKNRHLSNHHGKEDKVIFLPSSSDKVKDGIDKIKALQRNKKSSTTQIKSGILKESHTTKYSDIASTSSLNFESQQTQVSIHSSSDISLDDPTLETEISCDVSLASSASSSTTVSCPTSPVFDKPVMSPPNLSELTQANMNKYISPSKPCKSPVPLQHGDLPHWATDLSKKMLEVEKSKLAY